MQQLINAVLSATVFAAVIGLIGSAVRYFRDRADERKRVTQAILGEIRRLLIAIKGHRQFWYEQLKSVEERERFPLIPFSYLVYEEQSKDIGKVEKGLGARVVQFYGYVEYLNTLQSLRKQHTDPKDFDEIYKTALDNCLKDFFGAFDEDLKKRSIPLPESRKEVATGAGQ